MSPMPTTAAPHRRCGVIVAALVLAGAIAWAIAGFVASGGTLHRVPVLLVGPDVVAAGLVDEATALEGTPFVAGASEDLDEALAALQDGSTMAVLDIDLTGTVDTLHLSPRHGPQRDRVLTDTVTTLEEARGRTLEVSPAPSTGLGSLELTAVSSAAVLLGFLTVTVISLRRGPVPPTRRHGLARLGVVGGTAAVCGVLAAVLVDGSAAARLPLAAAAAVTVCATGALTLACEALLGLRGLVLAALGLLILPLPLTLAGDLALLPSPFAGIATWTLVGAGVEGVGELTGYSGAAVAPGAGDLTAALVRPATVLLGGTLLALVILLGAGRQLWGRRAAGSTVPAGQPPIPLDWRLQVGTLAVAAIGVTVAGFWAAALGDPGPRAPLPSLASTTECVTAAPVDSVEDLNQISELRGTPQMRGGDVGASVTLQDGRQIWMFGDTLRDAEAGGFVRNSLLLVDPPCLQIVLPQSGGAIIPSRSDSVGYWPMSVVRDSYPGYDLVTVTAQRVHTVDADDIFGFEALGPSLATFVVPVGETPQLVSQVDVGPDDADTTRPMWGAATAVAGSWLYLYGTSRPEEVEAGSGFALHLARTPLDRVADWEQWQFWDGAQWSADPADAVGLIGARDGVSQTLSVFQDGGTWFALSKRNEFLGEELIFWTAPSPEGPFTAHPPAGQLPSDTAEGLLRYMPLAHPDLLPEPGTVVVSYSQNTTDLDALIEDPLLYRPRFLRLDLPSPR